MYKIRKASRESILNKLLSNTYWVSQAQRNLILSCYMGLYRPKGSRWCIKNGPYQYGLQFSAQHINNIATHHPSYNPLIPFASQINSRIDLTTWNMSTWRLVGAESWVNGILPAPCQKCDLSIISDLQHGKSLTSREISIQRSF